MRRNLQKIESLESNDRADMAALEPLEPRQLLSVDFAAALLMPQGPPQFRSVGGLQRRRQGGHGCCQQQWQYGERFSRQRQGTFAAKVDYTTGAYPVTVMSADFNADGKATWPLSTSMAIRERISGQRQWNLRRQGRLRHGIGPGPVTSADFNADGK